MIVYIVIENCPGSLGQDEFEQIIGVYDSRPPALELIKKNKIKFASWAGECRIENHKIRSK